MIKFSNGFLKKECKSVETITPHIKKLAKEMALLMKEKDGVGLAANQIGKDLRLFVAQDEEGNIHTFVNPEIEKYSKKISITEEGCLSIPGFEALIKRSSKITLIAQDISEKKVKIRAKGLFARIIQHEVDHLNGILIRDKAIK